jgi:hypothetical protein
LACVGAAKVTEVSATDATYVESSVQAVASSSELSSPAQLASVFSTSEDRHDHQVAEVDASYRRKDMSDLRAVVSTDAGNAALR